MKGAGADEDVVVLKGVGAVEKVWNGEGAEAREDSGALEGVGVVEDVGLRSLELTDLLLSWKQKLT